MYLPSMYFVEKNPVIAQVVGLKNTEPTTNQVLQLGNPTPNVTSM
jgi:hypothetical protein